MFCRICGNRLPNDAIFCNACGSRVSTSSVELPESTPGGTIANSLNSAPVPPPTEYYSPTMPARPGPFTTPLAPAQPTTLPWSPPLSTSPTGSPYQPVQWPATPPINLPPLNTLQQFLVRTFQPAMASNALFGALLGGILAVVGGALLSWLLLIVAHAIAPHGVLYYTNSSEDSIGIALGIFPLHSNWRDSLQLFLVMHGVAQHSSYQSAAQNYSYTYSTVAPLSGLLVIPALLLTLGGYVAACTDLQNRVQSSLLRGAAIAIPYTVLLLIVVTQVNGPIPQGTGVSSTDTNTLSMDVALLVVFGLLWGVLFGMLGASLKLACGRWRHMIRQYFLYTRHPQVAGMIVGALAAAGVGLGLALLFVSGFLAYSSYSSSVLFSRLCYPGNWQYLLTWGVSQGPLHAANLYLFSFGSPITIINSGLQGNTCFYTNTPHTVLTLRDSSLHFPPWVYAVLLLPVISLFLGGRASVAVSRVRGIGPAAMQGALIAVPFTVLMVLLSLISAITYTNSYTSTTNSTASNTLSSAGAGAIDIILWVLLSGAVFGLLGGIYEASHLKTSVSKLFSTIGRALSLPASPVYLLFDTLSKQPPSSRTRARSLTYSTFVVALLLVIVALIVGGSLIAMNQTVSFQDNLRARDVVSTLLIILPGLLALSACVSALSADPEAR